MGLEEIHQFTTHGVGLDIDIETFEGDPFTLKLETFSVGDAASNYAWHFSGESQSSDRIKRTIFYSGTQDAMFTTRDRDNDIWDDNNCASDQNRGGWRYGMWYGYCTYINLNGDYEGDVTPTLTGILVRFIDTTSSYSSATKAVKSVEMIIRTRVD